MRRWKKDKEMEVLGEEDEQEHEDLTCHSFFLFFFIFLIHKIHEWLFHLFLIQNFPTWRPTRSHGGVDPVKIKGGLKVAKGGKLKGLESDFF